MFRRLLLGISILLVPGIFCIPAQAQYPTQWHVNGNGYVGLLIYTVDPSTFKVQGTLLGTPCEGVLVGRRLILHRTPRGSQIWEGWIMDAGLGAPGQPYYRGQYFIAGTISENQANNSLYPWYGVPTSAGPPPWNTSGGGGFTGVGGGQPGGGSQPGFTGVGQPGYVGGGGQPGYTGIGQPGTTSGGSQPGATGVGQPGYTGGGSQPGFTGVGQPGYTGSGQLGGGNLVVNGSFEQSPQAGSYLTLAAGDDRLVGWSITKGTVDLHGTYLKAGHGEKSIDLIGTPGSGGIRQTINTIPGQFYQLSFLMAGNCTGGEPVKQMTVRAGGTGRSESFNITGHDNQNPGWVRRGFTFQANSSQTVLEFSDPGAPDSGERYGVALDNVVVVPTGASGVTTGGGTTVSPNPVTPGAGSIALTPDLWQAHQNGESQCSKPGGQLCIDSMTAGGAYFTTPRRYGMDHDYTVSFEVQLTEENNHYPILYSDGFVSVDIDWGTDLGHVQPGMSYGLRSGLGRLEVGRWYRIGVDAHPSQQTFDLYLDGQKISTATGIQFPHPYHTQSVRNTQSGINNNSIFVGDPDDVSHQGGAYNRGGVCWRNIRVSSQGGIVQVTGQPGGGATANPNPVTTGAASVALAPGVWQPFQNGQGKCSTPGGQLCIDSMAPGGAYFAARRPYELDYDYTVSFEVQLTEDNNHFPILYSDGFVSVDIDWGTDLGHTQPGASYGLRNGLGNLEVGRWYTIRVDAHPSQRAFDLYLDGNKVSTATNVALPHSFHVDSNMPGISTEAIVIGDIDDVSYQGGAYNRGGVCWRNFRISSQGGVVR